MNINDCRFATHTYRSARPPSYGSRHGSTPSTQQSPAVSSYYHNLEYGDPDASRTFGTVDIDAACFGRPPLPPRTPASNGPPQACVLDKIIQFITELELPATDPEERLVALKFLLHFVGDMHQPLHSSDHNDRGGNSVKVIVRMGSGLGQRLGHGGVSDFQSRCLR